MIHKTITHQELVEVLRAHKGATPISFSAFTTVKARKTGNPYDAILKFSIVNAFTGHDYEASVNRQLVREGQAPDFQERGRSWGTNINNILSEKDGKFYLRVRPLKTSSPLYFVKVGGTIKRVDKTKIQAFLPPTYHSQIQNTSTEILHREYLVTNLRSVTLGGVRYEILPS